MKEVVLPFASAFRLAVKENIERDQRKGLISKVHGDVADLYEEEARDVLIRTGANYKPEYPDHHFIKVEGFIDER